MVNAILIPFMRYKNGRKAVKKVLNHSHYSRIMALA